MDINKGDYKTKVNQLVANLSKKIVGSNNGVENANSSDWMIKHFFKLEIIIYKIKALRGSSYIPLTDFLNHPRSGLINIKNDDNQCFKWCVINHKSQRKKNDDRVSALKKVNCDYDFTNVNFPATYDDIETFEQNNNESVFVYAITEKDTVVLSRQGNYENYDKNNGNRINLLLISNGDANH